MLQLLLKQVGPPLAAELIVSHSERSGDDAEGVGVTVTHRAFLKERLVSYFYHTTSAGKE